MNNYGAKARGMMSVSDPVNGLNIREFFVAAALQALLTNPNTSGDLSESVKTAVDAAAAALEALQK